MNYWLVDSKKAEGEPAAAPLTDEEEMVKYWKIFSNPKVKRITFAFVLGNKDDQTFLNNSFI